MKPPLVSVLMSTKDEKFEYLKTAVESILDQTYKNWEFLIMDDGSAALDNYNWLVEQTKKDLRIKVFHGEKSLGLACALNILIEKAQGEYFARMDSDDKAYPQRLGKEVEYLIHYPTTVLVGTGIRIVDDGGNTIHFSSKPDSFDPPWTRPAHSTWCGSMEVMKKIGGYSEDFPVSQDYDCWLRFQKYGRIGLIEDILLDYRWGRVSSEKGHEQIKYFWIANQLEEQRVNKLPYDMEMVKKKLEKYAFWYDRKFRSWAIVQKGLRFWQQGDQKKALTGCIKAIKACPFSLENWIYFFTMLVFSTYPSKFRKFFQLQVYFRKFRLVNPVYTQKAVCISDRKHEYKLAFIVPTVNREKSLWDLLITMNREKKHVSQVIIVDAGSLDNKKLIDDFKGLKIDYIRCSQASLTKQRNIGIAALDKDIDLVGFLDDDIIFEENAVKAMLDFWKENDSDIGGVACNIINVPHSRTSPFKKFFLTGHDEQGKVLRSGYSSMLSPVDSDIFTDWIFGGATVWKREVFDDFKFDEWFNGYGYGEDMDFSYTVSKKYRLAAISSSKVQHIKEPVQNMDNFTFGKMQMVNRHHFICKYKEFSKPLFFWAAFGQMLENLYLGIFKKKKEYFYRLMGNLIGLKIIIFYRHKD